MAVAKFSSRKSRRQESSDIEDEGPSNRSGRDQVSRRHASDRKENIRQDGDDEDDEEIIDINNFQDQPLGKDDGRKLMNIGRDWLNMEQVVKQNWKVVGDVAVSIADNGEGEDVEKDLAELDKMMRDLIDIGVEMRSHQQTLDDMAQKIAQGEEIDDALARYERGVKERMVEYATRTTRQKYAKSEEYTSFKHGIYEVQFPDKAAPPITDFIPKENGDDSDDDDDLEVGGFTQVYTCPITLVPLDNPVTSEICGHSFSAEAIRQTFRGSRIVKCPAAGCDKDLLQSQLKPNKDLAKKVKAWKRRAQRAAEDMDAEEIID